MKYFVLILALLLVACTPEVEVPDVPEIPERPPADYDAIADDIFTLFKEENVTSNDVSINGIMVGDSKSYVLEKLGAPDYYNAFEGEGVFLENLEYGSSLGLEKVGLILHIENDVVTRINVKEPFNPFLHGVTVIAEDKEEVFFDYGIPDEKAIYYRFILYQYNDYGLEIITYLGEEVGFALVEPSETNRVVDNNATEFKYVPYADTIVFE